MNRAIWMICQALAIGGLTWLMVTSEDSPGSPERPSPVFMFIASVVLVGIATVIITRLWDWSGRKVRSILPDRHKTREESVGPCGARLASREPAEKPRRLR